MFAGFSELNFENLTVWYECACCVDVFFTFGIMASFSLEEDAMFFSQNQMMMVKMIHLVCLMMTRSLMRFRYLMLIIRIFLMQRIFNCHLLSPRCLMGEYII